MCPQTPGSNLAHFPEQRVSAFAHSSDGPIPSSLCAASPKRPLTKVLQCETMLPSSHTGKRCASPNSKFTSGVLTLKGRLPPKGSKCDFATFH